jgi:hypothetical protein
MKSYNRFKVLMSASVPRGGGKYYVPPRGQLIIEEAAISLTRSVLARGGQLICGGHPSMTPLIAMVATDFAYTPDPGDQEPSQPPVIIYQSRVYREVLPDATWKLFQTGKAQIRWTEATNNETFVPEKGRGQCPYSETLMRRTMIEEKLDGMVCIGGMEGVQEEVNIFMEQHRDNPVYLLPSTGGMTMELATSSKAPHYQFRIMYHEDNFSWMESDATAETSFGAEYLYPYAYLTNRIIEEITANK